MKPPQKFDAELAQFDNLYCVHSTSGKVSNEIMKRWFKEIVLPNVTPGSLFLLDDWSGFNQMVEEHTAMSGEIFFARIPPGTTGLIQPCDREYFRQFKVSNKFPA